MADDNLATHRQISLNKLHVHLIAEVLVLVT